MAVGERCRSSLSGSCLTQCRCLLFGDGGTDAVQEGEEEGQVDGSGDSGAVCEVVGCEGIDKTLQGSVWREETQLRLCCHC